jgi:hypothetical protein
MTGPRELAEARRIQSQGRILEALAEDDDGLTGTLARLSKQFGLSPDDLRTYLLELAYAGWITIHIQPFGRLTIQLEQQGQDARPVTVAGCRSVPDAWRL